MTAKSPEKEECLTLTVPEAGRLLGLGRNLAYEAAHRGEIPVLKIGHRIVVPRAAFMRMLEGAPGDGAA